jgi:hypothetical protein
MTSVQAAIIAHQARHQELLRELRERAARAAGWSVCPVCRDLVDDVLSHAKGENDDEEHRRAADVLEVMSL